MTRRPDSFPAPHERKILEGDAPAAATPSPSFFLAGEVRAINTQLAGLPPERVAAIMPSWHASWQELQRQRLDVRGADELAVIGKWADHWRKQLETFEASPGTSRGITQTPTHFGERGTGARGAARPSRPVKSHEVGTDERTFRVQK